MRCAPRSASPADRSLTEALLRAAPTAHSGPVVSVDLFYDDDDTRAKGAAGALAIEMESATLFALGARARVPVACVLAVSDTFDSSGARTRIDDHALLVAAEAMGAIALAALAKRGHDSSWPAPAQYRTLPDSAQD